MVSGFAWTKIVMTYYAPRPTVSRVLAVALGTSLISGPQAVQAQNGGFRLTVVPESIGTSYNMPMADYHVFFVGEPVRVAVKLINHTREEFRPQGMVPLADAVVKSIQRRREADRDVVSTVTWSRYSAVRHALDGTSPISPGNYAEMRWSLNNGGGGPLEVGIYDLTVRYPIRSNHELSERVAVEVREPKTRADQMDALMHAAIRARWEIRLIEAEVLLKQLLALNPVSAVAYAELAEVLKGRGDCTGAVAAIDQALSLIKAGSDRESVLFANPTALSGWASGLRGARQACK